MRKKSYLVIFLACLIGIAAVLSTAARADDVVPMDLKLRKGIEVTDDAVTIKGGRSLSAGLSVHAIISTNTTLTAADINGGIIPLSGDGTTITLPAVSAATVGKFVSFYVTDATAKHIDTNAADKHTLRGTALDDGDKLSCAASSTGSIITIYCLDTTGWIEPKGTSYDWTDGGA